MRAVVPMIMREKIKAKGRTLRIGKDVKSLNKIIWLLASVV
jgi:hypothetical protein